MSTLINIPGVRRSVASTPADTNEATLFTAGAKGATVVWICISNRENAANLATVKWNNGTDYPIYTSKSIAANDAEFKDLHIELPSAGTIKITSSDADELTFTITVVESIGGIGGEHAH